MAQITSKYLGKYTEKISNIELAQIFFQTLDSQALLSADITIGGTTYQHDSNTVADVLQALSGSGSGAKYALRRYTPTPASLVLDNLPNNDDGATWYCLYEQVYVSGVAKWKCVYSAPITLYVIASDRTSSSISYDVTASQNTIKLYEDTGDTTAATAKNTITISSVPKASKILTSASIGSDTQPVYIAADGTPTAVSKPLATQEALEDAIAGVTKAYVTKASNLTDSTKVYPSGQWDKLVVAKTATQQQVTVEINTVAIDASYFTTTDNQKVFTNELNIGDVIYLTDADKCDWFLGSITINGGKTLFNFYSIEADTPNIANMVTSSGNLTTGNIILGNNGDKTVKDSGISINYAGSLASSSITIPTETVVKSYVDSKKDIYVQPKFSTGIKIGEGYVGSDASSSYDLYVPTGTSSTTVAVGNHHHGLITSSGAILPINTKEIETGDRLVIARQTDGVITTALYTFEAGVTTKALSKAGTWVDLLQATSPIIGPGSSGSAASDSWYSAFVVNSQGLITNVGYQIAYFTDNNTDVDYESGSVGANNLTPIPNGGTVIILSPISNSNS